MSRLPVNRCGLTALIFATVVMTSCGQESPEVIDGPALAKAASGPTVTSTDPGASPRDTTLDVRVLGTGFGSGSRADFLLGGTADPKVRTNNTRFVSSTELVANITIDASAVPTYRDVAVTTAAGKKGIGSERFIVLESGEMTIEGINNPEAWDVNGSGLAVGMGAITGSSCTGRAFTWSAVEGGTVLPIPAGFCAASGRRVNDAGVLAGTVSTAAGLNSQQIARWTPTGPGTWSIEVVPKPLTNLLWMTLHGVNAGGSMISTWKNPDGTWDSWIYRNTGGWLRLAKRPGSAWCSVEDINNAEQMTGYCQGTSGGAVYWATPASAPVVLPPVAGGVSSSGRAINGFGVVVGSYLVGSQERAARWRPNGSGGWFIDDLGAVGAANALNDEGLITGINNGALFYIPVGSMPTPLSPVSPPGTTPFITLGNRGIDGVAWIVGWGPTGVSGKYRALWWRK